MRRRRRTISFPYLVNDASLANSETTLLLIAFNSVYFDSVVVDATVANAVLLLSLVFNRVDTLLPLPSLRCFVEGTTDGATLFAFSLVAELMAVVSTMISCLSGSLTSFDLDDGNDADVVCVTTFDTVEFAALTIASFVSGVAKDFAVVVLIVVLVGSDEVWT